MAGKKPELLHLNNLELIKYNTTIHLFTNPIDIQVIHNDRLYVEMGAGLTLEFVPRTVGQLLYVIGDRLQVLLCFCAGYSMVQIFSADAFPDQCCVIL